MTLKMMFVHTGWPPSFHRFQVCWLRSRVPGQPGVPEQRRESACEVERQPATACDFDVVEGITADAFERDYLSVRRPVLVRGMLKGKAAFLKKWTRDEISANHEDVLLSTRSRLGYHGWIGEAYVSRGAVLVRCWCGVGAVRCGAVRCGAVRCGAVRCGAVRCGAVRCGAVRCGVVCYRGLGTISL